jgi:hypothetical protein
MLLGVLCCFVVKFFARGDVDRHLIRDTQENERVEMDIQTRRSNGRCGRSTERLLSSAVRNSGCETESFHESFWQASGNSTFSV